MDRDVLSEHGVVACYGEYHFGGYSCVENFDMWRIEWRDWLLLPL